MRRQPALAPRTRVCFNVPPMRVSAAHTRRVRVRRALAAAVATSLCTTWPFAPHAGVAADMSTLEAARTTVANSLWANDAFPGSPPVPAHGRLTIAYFNHSGGGRVTQVHLVLGTKDRQGKSQLLPPAPPYYPFPRGKVHTRGSLWSFTVG